MPKMREVTRKSKATVKVAQELKTELVEINGQMVVMKVIPAKPVPRGLTARCK